jgi:hypothetical protein
MKLDVNGEEIGTVNDTDTVVVGDNMSAVWEPWTKSAALSSCAETQQLHLN